MKKIGLIFLALVIILSVFFLGFEQTKSQEPNLYYNVFLDGELIGTVSSKEKLDDYIDKQNEAIKEKYNVDTVFSPKGLEIKQVLTYSGAVKNVEDIYNLIKAKKAFTILGYQMTVQNDDEEFYVFATNESVFSGALEKTVETFVGTEEYKSYVNKTQEEIVSTGEVIENVYIENKKTLKETFISVDEKIYTDQEELSRFLIFGENTEEDKYTVKLGDTVEDIAFNNEISIEELLLSNQDLTTSNSLLYNGQAIKIIKTDPKVKVVVEKYVVEDVKSSYRTIEQYDEEATIGDDRITQYGSDGLIRIYKSEKLVNGAITYVNTENKLEIKPTINKIIVIGKKYVPTIGSLTSWDWPTDNGYTITSYYGYRTHPITGRRNFHAGIDIALPYGSNVYTANNGIVETVGYYCGKIVNGVFSSVNSYCARACSGISSYGNYIVINHNNGYKTLYAHLSKIYVQEGQTVEKGTIIGAIGMTGCASGPHLHYSIYNGIYMSDGTSVNPLRMY